MEIWKEIKNYEGLYEVSNLGNVRRKESEIIRKDGRIMKIKQKKIKQQVNNNIPLCKNGEVKLFKINRLVAECFVENKFNKNLVNHIDGNKSNNNANNLEWVSRKDISVHSLPRNEKIKYGMKFNEDGKKYISENKGKIKIDRLAKIFEVSIVDIKRVFESETI